MAGCTGLIMLVTFFFIFFIFFFENWSSGLRGINDVLCFVRRKTLAVCVLAYEALVYVKDTVVV